MAVTTYGFENGTDGVGLTAAKIGGYVANAGKFAAASKMHGSLGANFPASKLYYRMGWSLGSATKVAVRFYCRVNTPNVLLSIMQLTDSAGSAMLSLSWDPANLYFNCTTTGGGSIGGTHITATDATYVRVEVLADLTAGSASYAIYEGDSTTALGSLSTASGLTFGGKTAFANFDLGIPSGSGLTSGSVDFDDVAYNPGGSAFIGVYTPPPPPTARVKAWNGTAWTVIKAWSGTEWVPVKAWTGSAWV